MVHADVTPKYDRILLTPEWNESELLKLIPGSSFKHKEWTLPLTWASMLTLRGIFGQRLTYSPALEQWTWDVRKNRVDVSLQLRELIDWPVDTDEDLRKFQLAGVEWMTVAQNGLLGDELGAGKTPQAIVYLARHNLLPAIIICPNSLKWHWAARLPRWFPKATPYVVDGGTAKARKIIAEARQDPTAVVIVNYESTRALSRLAPYSSVKLRRCRQCDPKFGEDIRPSQCHVHPKELNGFGFVAVIMDEIHNIGEPTSQQTRATWAIAHDKSVQHRWGLTGTPDNMRRLWSIMHAIAPDEYPTRSKWMDRYALQAWNAFGGTDVVGIRPDTRAELLHILDPRFRRMIKSVVLPQLPPIVRQVRYCTFTPSMRKVYDELNDHLFTRLPDGQLFIAQNKLVSRTRLMQFASGTVHVEKPDPDDVSSWKVRIAEPSPKIDELDRVLDELENKPFVVACVHRDVMDMVAERLGRRGIKHQLIAGGVHPQVREQATQDLKSGALKALVFIHKAGGAGLDMSGADTMIVVQRSWSLIENIQTEGRTHRIGSEIHDSITIIDVVMKDSIEEHQVAKLHEKFEQLEEIARDREQVQKRLAETPFTSEEFMELVAKLDSLNKLQDQILTQDDIESFQTMEASE